MDTLKEIADWIANDETATSNMLASINQNKTNITSLNTNLANNYYSKTDLANKTLQGSCYSTTNTLVVQPTDNYNGRVELSAGNNNQYIVAVNTKASTREDGFRGLAIGNQDIKIEGNGLTYKNRNNNKTWQFDNVVQNSDIENLSAVTLNGSANTTPNFYAPTTSGSQGQILKSNGSGAPVWENYAVDNALSSTSENPVQNKAIANKFENFSFDDLKRIRQSIYTQNAIWYYPIAKLPVNNAGNYCSIVLTGRIGGWVKSNMSFINALVSNRDGEYGVVFNLGQNSPEALAVTDIVVYKQTDNTSIVYLKSQGYANFDLNINTFQAEYIYNGEYTLTPTGTLAWAASTSQDRLAIYNGNAYVNGQQLATVNNSSSIIKVENNAINLYIGTTKVASITNDGELKVKSINLVDSL